MSKKLPKKNVTLRDGGQMGKVGERNSPAPKVEAIDLAVIFEEPNFVPTNLM